MPSSLIFAARRFAPLLLVLAAGPALAQNIPPPAPAVVPPLAEQAEAPAADGHLPKQELSGQILYQFLLAEIAGQRGQLALASGLYLDLAKTTRDPRIVRRAAEVAFYAKQYEQALEAVRLWLELEPEAKQARQMEATLLLASGRVDELAKRFGGELKLAGPRAGELLLQLAQVFARYPDKAVVARLFEQVTAPWPNLPEAHLLRSQAALGVGDKARAGAEIDQALALRPDWELAALLKADQLPRGAAQLDYLKQFLLAHPQANDVRLGYARTLVAEKRYAEARGEFQTLLAVRPDHPDVLFAVGVLSLQLDDTAEAEYRLRRFVEIGRGDLDTARYYLGQIADQDKRSDQALAWYQAVAAGEHLLPARVRAAQILFQQNKLDAAREQLEAARAVLPGDVRLTIAEAQLMRDAGHHADAYALLSEALAAQPDDPDLLYETALAAEALGYLDVLEKHLRRLIELKPDSAQAYNGLGYSLADHDQRLPEAAQLIDKALELAPNDPFILDSKGWVSFRQGQLEPALEYLRRAYTQRSDPEIAAHIGEVLWALGRRDEALKLWREAAKTHPQNKALETTIKRFVP
ncbi:MAG: hypothetical protein CVU17_00860 [Betaproteobacteria bacterium HGW-Betaproteobacteria-11]|nr:MAG: hypothetical protein CVU17_00860 [Betaproteobacteria bacterium HGW-Betaproteobacteria-11]